MCSRGNCKILFHSGIWANECVVWVMHICNPCGKLRGLRKKVSVIHWGLASRNHLFRNIYLGWNNVKNVLSSLSACEHCKNHSTSISIKTGGGVGNLYLLFSSLHLQTNNSPCTIRDLMLIIFYQIKKPKWIFVEPEIQKTLATWFTNEKVKNLYRFCRHCVQINF